MFELYYSVYDEVNRANAHLQLDQLVKNKKATLAEFKKAFTEIIKAKKSFDDYDDVVDTVSVEEIDSTAAVVEEDYYDETVVDTAAVEEVVDRMESDDYLHVDNPKDLYNTVTPKEIIQEKWKLIIDFYTRKETYDEEFAILCKRELRHTGFLYKLYGQPKALSDIDFVLLDYLLKYYQEISEKDRNSVENGYSPLSAFNFANVNDNINEVFSAFFDNPQSATFPLSKTHQLKLVEYYKKYLKVSGFKPQDFRNYLALIKEAYPNDYSLYFQEYNEFFQTIASKNSSLLETLDEIYSAQKKKNSSWFAFKEDFSDLANTVAWQVVETKSKEASTIRKAIQWSEASLKIFKTDYRYLDTLAQLYYMNDQKEKALQTEQKAIDNVPTEDKSTLNEYKEVLERMQNGTY